MLILYTKDGTRRSNAILYGGEDYSLVTEGPIYLVESDFGNHMRLTLPEIMEQYTLGPVRDYNQWRNDRQEAINRPILSSDDRSLTEGYIHDHLSNHHR